MEVMFLKNQQHNYSWMDHKKMIL